MERGVIRQPADQGVFRFITHLKQKDINYETLYSDSSRLRAFIGVLVYAAVVNKFLK